MTVAWALLRRWWHCLTHLHRSETWHDTLLGEVAYGCECGRVFYDPSRMFTKLHHMVVRK